MSEVNSLFAVGVDLSVRDRFDQLHGALAVNAAVGDVISDVIVVVVVVVVGLFGFLFGLGFLPKLDPILELFQLRVLSLRFFLFLSFFLILCFFPLFSSPFFLSFSFFIKFSLLLSFSFFGFRSKSISLFLFELLLLDAFLSTKTLLKEVLIIFLHFFTNYMALF